MTVFIVYVTTSGFAQAETLGKTLIQEKLAACANITEGMTTIYPWKGKMEQQQEAVLLLKTHEKLLERLRQRIRELHSYETPCIMAWPVPFVDRDYAAWLEDSVTGQTP
ncbi:MAG: divalent-cation tolerance protein CutA [Pseudomonadota bacterium]|nr:divalent-cation tolerance protein CutA [Pseudomonadota bacterium]